MRYVLLFLLLAAPAAALTPFSDADAAAVIPYMLGFILLQFIVNMVLLFKLVKRPKARAPAQQQPSASLTQAQEYTRTLRSKGLSEQQIRQQFKAGGWPDEQIDEAMK